MSQIPHPDCGYCGNDDCPLCGERESEGVVVEIWESYPDGYSGGYAIKGVRIGELKPGRYRLTRIEEGEA